MKPERWQQVDDLFQAALEREPEERAAFIQESCAGDESLRRQVEELIAADGEAGSLVEAPAYALAAPLIAGDAAQSLVSKSISHYQIISLLGKGGMGEVYHARDTRLDRTVALKILPAEMSADAERMRRFVREAKAASSLNHANVAHIYEIGEADGQSFIAMEYIEGQTLAAKINGHPLETGEIVEIGIQIADALDEAHRKGITHRDIKSANVMLTPRAQVKVLDFGLAKVGRPESVDSNVSTLVPTAPGIVLGTVPYMSPEQALGRDVDHRSDLFSLGVVLYEMATGRLPFSGANTSETLDRILHAQPEAMARFNYDMPAELERIARKCLEKDREQRYQSARDLLIDLRTLKRDSGSKTVNIGRAAASSSRRLSRLSLAAVALVILMLVIVGIAYVPPLIVQKSKIGELPRSLRRLTFDRGLQSEPAWSPDGRFIAYSSDRNGNFDIWVKPVSGGDAMPITNDQAHDWQPDWSPDGSHIVFRSERDGGGLFLVPPLGGQPRKVSTFGYRPRWSPDGSRILFYDSILGSAIEPAGVFVVGLDGSPPRQVLIDFLSGFSFPRFQGVSWHPDSQRVSVLWEAEAGDWNFWTVPLGGGAPIKSEISADVEGQIKAASIGLSRFPFSIFDNLLWSPSGKAVFFEAQSKGVRNLWKVTVDPRTLRWVAGPERMTAGQGSDTDMAISRDGGKMAYTTRSESTRIWVQPFDAASGQVKGEGKAVTEAGVDIISPGLSPDGKKLVYVAYQTGRRELWVQSLEDGHKTLLFEGDESARITSARWSRDGTRLMFRRPPATGPGVTEMDGPIVSVRADGSDEQLFKSTTGGHTTFGEWTRDGQWNLRNLGRGNPRRYGIYLYPISAATQDETSARVVAAHPEQNLWSAHLSPDDRWISFNCVKAADAGFSTVYVVRFSGGEWTRITEGIHWDDKPNWSPDGRTIYFFSSRTGFFNVWGLRFDLAQGKPVGQPFRVTAYESSSRMIKPNTSTMHMSITSDRLMLPITEASGSIWVVENVDR
jgi:serine/threonine protein kinase